MKLLGKLLTIALVLGVGVGIYLSANNQLKRAQMVQVTGIAGSEKLPLFNDPTFTEYTSDSPLYLEALVDKAGSREIATSYDLSGYDFVFPSGLPAAEKLRVEQNIKHPQRPFYSPMAIASWKPVVDVLMENGIVERRDSEHYVINMEKLIRLSIEHKRWNELPQSNATFPARTTILVTTTDVRKSNSAAMYLSLASYILNDNQIVQSREQAKSIIDELAELFIRQGFTESSSQLPFNNYLIFGPGKSPLTWVYEQQFLAEATKENSAITDDMILLYPEPAIFTAHIYLPLTDAGERLGEALMNDEQLQQLAILHGLRTADTNGFKAHVESHGLTLPNQIYNVIEPPSYELLEWMITEIEQRYQ